MSTIATPDQFTTLPDEPTIASAVTALEEHGFSVEVVDDLDAARQAVLARIPHGSSVMTNTSVTLRLGFSLALAIIGGPPVRFAAYSQLFQRALEKFGRPPLPVLVHSPGHVAATDEQAKAEFWPRWRQIIALIAPERGFAIPTEESFDWETGPHGALYVGSPETVAQKIVTNLRALGATRFDLKYGMPGLTHDQLMTNIELYGRQVIPRARELLS